MLYYPILFLTLTSSYVVLTAGSQLLSVIVMHRHGDRNPLKSYKTDPYRNESDWPEGFAQLNKRGIQRQYDFGVWLRTRYASFLPVRYSPRTLFVVSTDVDRTLMSAEVTLAGLFPPSDEEKWNRDIPWRPIPVHTTPTRQDPVYAGKKFCKKFSRLYKELLRSKRVKEIEEVNGDLFRFLTERSGENITSILDLEILYNTLLTESLAGKKLPEWTIDVFPEKMKEIAVLKYKLPCYNTEMARLAVGLLFGEVVKRFRGFTEGKGDIPMLIFSGHDRNLANVLSVLGAFNDEIPPYSSAVIFELKVKDGGYFVNIFLKNGTKVDEIVLKNCQFECSFDDFVKILEPVVVENVNQWEKECEN